ncbi:hypothetical protein AB0M43_14535 [Longispora sp. NPDC051575]|uniref:hypothetical protein n=1 Tax=Longispora sp. NPDC051575 TaxID=3154943 RepID=UPI003427561F
MSDYIAQYDDLVIDKAQVGRTTTPTVYRVEVITKGRKPVGIYDTAGTFYKVSDDVLEKYDGDDYDRIAATFPDNSPLPRGAIVYFPAGTGGEPTHKLWIVTDMTPAGLYAIALFGGGTARRGYPRRALPVISRADATDHLVNDRA